MVKVKSLTLKSPAYPDNLASIADPPQKLYYLGEPPKNWIKRPKVAVVGARKMTAYGREVTTKLVGELTRYDVVIISGLALGIDSVAHAACLEKGGTTIAVLPTGLDKIYPASHRNLAIQVLKNKGTLLSEYAHGSPAYKLNFVARNRIVSGLADVLLITEASAGSGTMHTATFALEQGRTVMAVPGNINSTSSQGTNNLIKSGAVPVTEVQDILLALNINSAAPPKRALRGSPDEVALMQAIVDGKHSQEELAIHLKMDAAKLSFILTSLEISGHIRPDGGGRWSLT